MSDVETDDENPIVHRTLIWRDPHLSALCRRLDGGAIKMYGNDSSRLPGDQVKKRAIDPNFVMESSESEPSDDENDPATE